jgi:hypothetical protein
MDWAGKSNRALVEAIIASFRDPPERSQHRLSEFSAEDWARTELWLETSGLALYFLDRLSLADMSSAIDSRILHKLEQERADNRKRMADMLKEFVAINRAFGEAGVRYANLKGFTLSPDSCPDLALRHQSDYDFLIDPAHLNLGRTLLEKRGYVVTGSTPRTLELKCGSPQKLSMDGRYKVNAARFAELHIAVASMAPIAGTVVRDERLNRVAQWKCGQESFPALSSADQLIGQALHCLGHLRGEHTRPSWLLEFRHHVMVRQGDAGFWKEVAALASGHLDATVALGLCTLLATEIFGPFASPELDSWTVDALPFGVKLWAERYGRRAVLADVPGTKLYLLLDSALTQTRSAHQLRDRALRLLPLRWPARILRPPVHDTLRLRLHREIVQLQYILYRVRFHLKQGALYFLEARRWNKILKKGGHEPPACTAECSTIAGWREESRTTQDLR